MFEQHFGLTRRPFDSLATGADVFLGPQATTLIRLTGKALSPPDAVACISGPVGSGKTTLVARSLSGLGRKHTVIRVGRMKLVADEVLDFLLRELGLKQMPASTIQKITVFRGILKKLEDGDVRLFIVVEDAARLGNVALQELEALTASDSGVSDGANLVIMNEEALKPVLDAPGLKRLKQRTRLHFALQPMTSAEVSGYLTHALRQAGGDISGIMTDDAISTVHALTEGIPRLVNNLVSSALESAADKGLQRLDAEELRRVAAEEYGLEIDESEVQAPIAAESKLAPIRPESRSDVEEAAEHDAPAVATRDNVVPVTPLESEAEAPTAMGAEPATLLESEAEAPTAMGAEPATLLEIEAEAPEAVPAELDPPLESEEQAEAVEAVEADPPLESEEQAEAVEAVEDESAERLSADEKLAESDEFEIPELIQDTQPGLEALSSLPEQAAEADTDDIEPVLQDEDLPTLAVSDNEAVQPGTPSVHPRVDEPEESHAQTFAATVTEAEHVELEPVAATIDEPEQADAPAFSATVTEAGQSELRPVTATFDEPIISDADAFTLTADEPEPEAAQDLSPANDELDHQDALALARAAGELSLQAPKEPDDDAADDGIPTLHDSVGEPDFPPTDQLAGRQPNLEESLNQVQDPTLAELKPDFAALERAMAAPDTDIAESDEPAAIDLGSPDAPELELQFTLDDSIRRSVNIAEAALKAAEEDAATSDPAAANEFDSMATTIVEDQVEAQTEADEKLDRIAAELAKAKSIDDVGDELAETLFGEEFSMMAAEVAARVAANSPIEDESEPASISVGGNDFVIADTSPVAAIDSAGDTEDASSDAGPDQEDALGQQYKELYGEEAIAVSMETTPTGLGISASQRLATVKALNAAARNRGSAMQKGDGASSPVDPGPQPIEDQINLSLTQTLKGLSIEDIQAMAEEEEKQKPGFFQRFRRSRST